MGAEEKKISDKDIVPDNIQDELIMIRSRHTMDYFRIGDIANDLLMQSAKTGMKVTAQRVHKAIGRYCGKRPRTVRYYAENAAFFSPATRDKYDMLPFSFFDFARTFGGQWEGILDWAALHPEYSMPQLQFEFSMSKITSHVNKELEEFSEDSPVIISDQDGILWETYAKADGSLVYKRHGVDDAVDSEPTGSVGNLGGQDAVDYFRLVAELGYCVEKVEGLIDVAVDDDPTTKELLSHVKHHLKKTQVWTRRYAEHMDEKKVVNQPDMYQVTVDFG
jgi:hypothetical protein